MSAFLTYSEIDTDIQTKMSNASPSSSARLIAINNSVQDLYAEYDLDSSKRDLIMYLVLDGSPIDLSSSVTDFKRALDLRYLSPNKHSKEFGFVDDDLFAVHVGENRPINEFTTTYNSGKLYMKAISEDGPTRTVLHDMGSLSSNGTWTADTANSDATAPSLSSVVSLNQGNNIAFNVDVSQTVSNYGLIYNSGMSSKDLSDYTSLGIFKFWIYIPTVTEFTSVELYWGNDSSNYWNRAVTTQADGTTLVNGWNEISINWADATENGTVDDSAIDYLAIKVNYSASYTDQNNFRVEKISCFLPTPMKLSYSTYYVSQTTDGTFQEEITTTTTDELLIPKRFKKLISLLARKYLGPIAYGSDANDFIAEIERDITQEKQNLKLDIGKQPKRPARKFKLRGI